MVRAPSHVVLAGASNVGLNERDVIREAKCIPVGVTRNGANFKCVQVSILQGISTDYKRRDRFSRGPPVAMLPPQLSSILPIRTTKTATTAQSVAPPFQQQSPVHPATPLTMLSCARHPEPHHSLCLITSSYTPSEIHPQVPGLSSHHSSSHAELGYLHRGYSKSPLECSGSMYETQAPTPSGSPYHGPEPSTMGLRLQLDTQKPSPVGLGLLPYNTPERPLLSPDSQSRTPEPSPLGQGLHYCTPEHSPMSSSSRYYTPEPFPLIHDLHYRTPEASPMSSSSRYYTPNSSPLSSHIGTIVPPVDSGSQYRTPELCHGSIGVAQCTRKLKFERLSV